MIIAKDCVAKSEAAEERSQFMNARLAFCPRARFWAGCLAQLGISYLHNAANEFRESPHALRWLIPFALIFGGAIELIQPLVNRAGEWADFWADGIGIGVGVAPGLSVHRTNFPGGWAPHVYQ